MWSFTWHWRIHITITGPEAFMIQRSTVPQCDHLVHAWMWKESVEGKQRACATDKLLPKTTHGKCKLIAHRQGKNNISAEPTSKYVIFTFPFRGQRSYQKTCSFIKVRVQVNTIKALTSQFYYKMFHQSFSLLGVVYYIIV